jgi:hypothetical protein
VASWVRHGECNRCGECCRSGDPFNGELGKPEIAGACPLLTLHRGVFTCSDRQHPYYLGGCNVWPSLPEHIEAYPSCSYTFSLEPDGG